ncbi:MAG TPA: xanthine dehydrogenase family protein molybdopterin-binding subunit [Candidatus Limnocylindrales bacterium]|nr:xanthine dehydrogenase family protein molybdopterin-binding subunit [Candidatus Limnocylindrales bacterium]
MTPAKGLDRRSFLKTAAASGLLLGFHLPGSRTARAETADARLNAWVHVAPDDTVTLYIHKAEMGQGTVTSLAMLLAEELECDWARVHTEFPGIDRAYGGNQGVVGSQSVRSSWEPLRRAGASARQMLVQAASQQWGVDAAQCQARNGVVINSATGAKLSYGALADAAAKLTPPANVPLKDPSQFTIIGKPRKRLDTPSKVNGSAQFGIDVRLPGMLYAVVARCPVFGGKVASFDATKAKAMPGVKHVVQISNGVAVVAENTWAAAQARKALEVKFDEGQWAGQSSAGIAKLFVEKSQQPGAVARKDGDAAGVLAGAAKKIEAVYEAPYLAHAPMEPLNATADVRSDSCEVWASTQGQSAAHQVAIQVTGLKPDQVKVHTCYMGGGFGRRARADYIGEAVEVSKAIGAPVQLVWTREDDMQQDWYRPASYTKFVGSVGTDGMPEALHSRVICAPFGGLRDGVSRTGVEGIMDMPYAIPNLLVDYHAADVGIPVSYWRSVGYSQNTFFAESFIDELAVAAGKDALEFRRALLGKQPRMLAALNLAAEKAGWGKPLPAGRGRGIAVVNNIGSYTAQIAEVSASNGKLRVHKVVCAVDCGHVVNPSGVEQQIQSGIVYGLSAALKGSITIDKGRVQQDNFHNYDVLRIDEMPVVEVHIVPSTANPGGIGEAAVPPIAAAVANALYAANGKRVRTLPLAVLNR